MDRHGIPCLTCHGSTRKGLLWLGGADWLECPSCNATGIVELVEERFVPRERTVLIPGLKAHIERHHHPSIQHLVG